MWQLFLFFNFLLFLWLLFFIFWWATVSYYVKLEAVLFREQVSARCGIVIVGLCCWLLNEVGIECFIRVAFVPWPAFKVKPKLHALRNFLAKMCFAKVNPLYEANVKRVAFVPWPSGNVQARYPKMCKLRSWFEALCSKRTNRAKFRSQYLLIRMEYGIFVISVLSTWV